MTENQGVNKDGVNSGVNTKQGADKDYAQHYYAPNYAAKTGFFSAQKIVRKVVRSKTEIRAKHGFKIKVRKVVRSKMMVNSLLVTSEVNSKKALFIIDR